MTLKHREKLECLHGKFNLRDATSFHMNKGYRCFYRREGIAHHTENMHSFLQKKGGQGTNLQNKSTN